MIVVNQIVVNQRELSVLENYRCWKIILVGETCQNSSSGEYSRGDIALVRNADDV